jgi:thioredoxin-related protein
MELTGAKVLAKRFVACYFCDTESRTFMKKDQIFVFCLLTMATVLNAQTNRNAVSTPATAKRDLTAKSSKSDTQPAPVAPRPLPRAEAAGKSNAAAGTGAHSNKTIPSKPVKPSAKTAKPATVKAPVVTKAPETIKWLTVEEVLEKAKTEKKKIFIDVYTDWCGWCKEMDKNTFTDETIVSYLNQNFLCVKFNAEQKTDITYKGKTYKFIGQNEKRGYHELAAFWLNNRLSYPTVVILDEEQTLLQPIPGYQEAAKMEVILHYFGTDSHKKVPWEKYEKTYTRGK